MNNDFLIVMKSEWSLIFIIFLLLFIKVSDVIKSNATLLHLSNILLFINFLFGFFFNKEGDLFSGMFFTNEAIAL